MAWRPSAPQSGHRRDNPVMCPGRPAHDGLPMTTLTSPQSPSTTPATAPARTTPARPRALRRTAVALTGTVACLLPVVFTVNIGRMLLTGVEADHRFHQATGQGLVLTALWLGALVPLVRAGWAGRRPPVSAGLLHLAFVLVGGLLCLAAPGGGAPALMAVIAVPGALLWAALPLRPRLRQRAQVDPVLAPVALLAAAVFTPFAVDQLALQNAAVGYHAQNPHLWDMAWMTVTLTVAALLAAVLPAARWLVTWLAVGATVTGAAGLAFGEPTSWSLLVLGLGVAAGVAAIVRQHLDRTR